MVEHPTGFHIVILRESHDMSAVYNELMGLAQQLLDKAAALRSAGDVQKATTIALHAKRVEGWAGEAWRAEGEGRLTDHWLNNVKQQAYGFLAL